MIIQEHFDVEERDFIRTYSNSHRYVVRDGVAYGEATDPAEFNRQYTEGNIMSEDDVAAEYKEILDILLGGEE